MAENIIIPDGFVLENNSIEIPDGFVLENNNTQALDNVQELSLDDNYVKTAKYQEEQLANLLFTPEELAEIDSKGPVNWWELAKRTDKTEKIPFAGAVESTFKTGRLGLISKKVENGEEISPEDTTFLNNYLKEYIEVSRRGTTFGANVANILMEVPAWAVEIGAVTYATGGTGTIPAVAKKVAEKAGTKTALAYTTKALLKSAQKAGVKGVAKTVAKSNAVLAPRIAENYAQRRITEGIAITDKGQAYLQEVDEKPAITLLKALADTNIEAGTEIIGGKYLNLAGTMLTNNVAGKAISEGFKKSFDLLPKKTRVALESAVQKLRPNETVESLIKKGGFHGVLEEMGEERIADILRTTLDLDAEQGYSIDQFMKAIYPSTDELLVELGAFSIMGGASRASSILYNNLRVKGYSHEEANTVVNNLSENEKDNLVNNEIVKGNFTVNSDITKEDLQEFAKEIKENNKSPKILYRNDKKPVEVEYYTNLNNKIVPLNIRKLNYSNSNVKDIKKTDIKKIVLGKNEKIYISNQNSNITASLTKTKLKKIISSIFSSENKTSLIRMEKEIISNIQEIFENSIPILKHKELKNSNLYEKQIVHRFALPIQIGKNNFLTMITVKERLDNKTTLVDEFAIYDLKSKINNRTLGSSSKSENSELSQYQVSNISIDELVNFVNSNLEKYKDNKTNIESQTTNKETLQDLLEDTTTSKTEKILSEKEKENIESSLQGYNLFDKFYRDWVDSLIPLEKLEKLASEKTDVPLAERPYFMARMYSGMVEGIKFQIEQKTFVYNKDGSITYTGEGLFPIIKDFNTLVKDVESNFKERMNDLTDYLVARRYLLDLKDREGYEASEEQKEKAIKDLARLNQKYDEKIEDFEKIANRFYKFNQRILHNLVDSGNMSQEVYDKIIEKNPHHVSYKRIMDENYGKAISKKSIFTRAKSPIKAIKGSEREIQNIFVSTLEDVSRILDIAYRNKVASNIANFKSILPEYIKAVKPKMELTTTKVKVAYDAKLRSMLEQAIKKFGGKLEQVKNIKSSGLVLGDYNPEEKKIRKRLGSQDRTLAHEFGHMLDFIFDVQSKITPEIKKELLELAEDRLTKVVTLSENVFIETDEGKDSQKYINYVKNNREIVANMFDLYFTSRDYLKKIAPKSFEMIEELFKNYEFLKDIRPSSQTEIEEIEQDVWTVSALEPNKKVITYYENGKRKFVEVPDVVLDAVESIKEPELNFLEKIGQWSANILRTGATITPEFAIRNFIRDQQASFMYYEGNNPLRPVLNIPKGIMAVLEKRIKGSNKLYDEWVASNGAFSSYMELNEKSIESAIKEYTGEFNKALKTTKDIATLKPLKEFASIFEEATRLSIYATEKLDGATALKSAFTAREGTLDFGRSGVQGKRANKYIPFFNAGIQGTDRLIRAFKKHPYLMSVKAFATMTIPQLAITGYYLFSAPDDERQEYLNIPDYQKAFFYCFKVGDTWVRLPKEFTLGYVFASTFEKLMIWAYQNKKTEAKGIYNYFVQLLGSAVPVSGPTDVLPPILRIAIENIANWDFFRNKHIYPEHLNDLEPSERYNKYTSETAKLLGEKLNMSPAKIEHAINSQLGTSGRYATDLGDLLIDEVRKLQGEEVNEKVSTKADKPFLRGFVLRDPIGYQALSTNQFFENYKRINEVNNTYKKYLKEGNREKAIAYRDKHENEFMALNRYKSTYKKIKSISKTMDNIYSNETLTGDEKLERLLPLQKRISDMSFDINIWYEENKRSRK